VAIGVRSPNIVDAIYADVEALERDELGWLLLCVLIQLLTLTPADSAIRLHDRMCSVDEGSAAKVVAS